MNSPYIIIETANTHGGNPDYLHSLISEFSDFQKGYGIKFQAFHPDGISLSDFSAYTDYQKLHIKSSHWKDIIHTAARTKDVWLDIFDSYGIKILENNLDKIFGIKFQSSVLQNHEVRLLLREVDLSRKKIIINIAARPLEEIRNLMEQIDSELAPNELLLELGYQSYPTKLEDSGINKIRQIRDNFANRVVFADHSEGSSEDAIWLPVLALMEGAEVIEKHVMLDRTDTKYDQYSSLVLPRFTEMTLHLMRYAELRAKPFIGKNEKAYLESTVMIPVLKTKKGVGELVNFESDLKYRRTSQKGLPPDKLLEMQHQRKVLTKEKLPDQTLCEHDYRPARIGSIIACRMKSQRLPKKALIPIQGIPAVELCIKNTLKINHLDSVSLASSNLDEDAVLSDHCYDPAVKFYAGDPINVIRRFFRVATEEKLDVIVRQTADNVFMSDEIFQHLLTSHFETGADFTTADKTALGTNFEIISMAALSKLNEIFPNAEYAEYMTWYFVNNPDYFNINKVKLPGELVRDYRLTLDYPEDADMFNQILKGLPKGIESGLPEIFSFLDRHPEIASVNRSMNVVYRSDPELIDKLNKITRIKHNQV